MQESGWSCRREQMIDIELQGRPLRLATRPGLPGWDSRRQAVQLLAEAAEILPGQRVLVFPSAQGALAVWATWHTGPERVAVWDTNVVAADTVSRTLAANGCAEVRVEVGLPSSSSRAYDVALVPLPKGRDLARLMLLEAYHALVSGGRLYLAGPNQGGIKSVIRDGEQLFGAASVLGYKGGNRVALFMKEQATLQALPDIYDRAGLRIGTYDTFEVTLDEQVFTVCTRPGVFSRHQLDAGTRLLLDAVQVGPSDMVLDVGCGYGIIGMYAARRTTGKVTLVDADWLACDCARASLARNGIERARVLMGDGLAAVSGQQFTLILSNPPFHAGHGVNLDVVRSFVQEARSTLLPSGRLVLVANRFLPYHRLMAEHFGSVSTLVETPQYHVLCAEANLPAPSAPSKSA